MRTIILVLLLVSFLPADAQKDTTTLRAFPITDYIMDLSDTVKLVQVQLPDGVSFREKQIGVLYGVYTSDRSDAVEKGFGRCNLIKGDYYYFTIGNNKSGKAISKGDLLYVTMPRTSAYESYLSKIAAHFIRLDDVYDNPFYDRYSIFDFWDTKKEQQAIDSMLNDIHFTGRYFKENQPSMDVKIKSGVNQGKSTLDLMITATSKELIEFFKYILARPRLYAGREWKIAEVFATWLSEGAPSVNG